MKKSYSLGKTILGCIGLLIFAFSMCTHQRLVYFAELEHFDNAFGVYYLPDGGTIRHASNTIAVINKDDGFSAHNIPTDGATCELRTNDELFFISHPDYDRGHGYKEPLPIKKKLVSVPNEQIYVLTEGPSIPVRRKSFFPTGTETRRFDTRYGTVYLKLTEDVFPPSPIGATFINHITISPGEKVIDVGTGSGLLGIAAAQAGGIVHATDISTEAIDLALKNARSNFVEIKTATGPYFAGFDGHKFDVIIANLPQEILPPKYSAQIGKLDTTINGGINGNEILLGFLKILPEYMYENSRAYVMVYSMTNYVESLQVISENYSARLLATERTPTKPFVAEYDSFYKKLRESGDIYVYNTDGDWNALAYIFELRLKA